MISEPASHQSSCPSGDARQSVMTAPTAPASSAHRRYNGSTIALQPASDFKLPEITIPSTAIKMIPAAIAPPMPGQM
eukprot:scaffold3179_cov59-Phaeocystis_antarctica.AAC.6